MKVPCLLGEEAAWESEPPRAVPTLYLFYDDSTPCVILCIVTSNYFWNKNAREMSYSFQKAHSYLINSLQIREKMFTETKIQSSFLGIRLKFQMKDDKSALPRSSEANSAELGRVAHEDISPENSIKIRLSIGFCSDIRPYEGCSQLLTSFSIY